MCGTFLLIILGLPHKAKKKYNIFMLRKQIQVTDTLAEVVSKKHLNVAVRSIIMIVISTVYAIVITGMVCFNWFHTTGHHGVFDIVMYCLCAALTILLIYVFLSSLFFTIIRRHSEIKEQFTKKASKIHDLTIGTLINAFICSLILIWYPVLGDALYEFGLSSIWAIVGLSGFFLLELFIVITLLIYGEYLICRKSVQ